MTLEWATEQAQEDNMLHDYLVLDGTISSVSESGRVYYAALQRQVNNGTIWSMQGSMGRAAMDAIQSGRILVGLQPHKDYWGNTVPGRDQLEAGTKGTRGFVEAAMGSEWADYMEGLR
jgi:hypothetical protein